MDEKRLCDAYEVFCDVYGDHTAYETFRHKHFDNPSISEEIVTLVDYQDGVPAGTNSFTGFPFQCGEKRVFAVHSNDTAVKSCFRGRHIFTSLIKQAISICQQTGVADLMLATPNENSYPGFKKLGFHEVGTLFSYAAIIRPIHFSSRVMLKRSAHLPGFKEEAFSEGGYTWQISLACPFSDEDLAVINGRGGVQVQHSRAYYEWKLGQFAEESKCYICVRKENKLTAFFVLYKEGNGKCAVCDWGLPDEKKAARYILLRTMRCLRRFGDMVVIQFVNQANQETDILPKAGLIIKKKLSPVMYYPLTDKVDEEALAYLNDFRTWSLRSIDGDTILLKK